MQRTQIYLPESQVKLLKRKAAEVDTSVSEVIRRAVAAQLTGREKSQKKRFRSAGESLLYLARKAEKMSLGGPRDLAKNMDKYLYGKDFC